MTREMIASILESEGIKAGAKGVFAIPEEREAACLVGAPGEMITVGRLAKIDVGPHAIALETTKSERFYFAYDDVVGLRFAVASKERSTGFKPAATP
jgi:hypothetical protein